MSDRDGCSGLRERLSAATGVWEGTYTHLAPDGTVTDRHGSRQETRLEGDLWYERIIYLRDGVAPEVIDFRARFDGDDLAFASASFEGRAQLVDGRFLLFPYRWSTEPDTEIVELVTFVTDDDRSRVWQKFHAGRLVRLTVIEEHRVHGQQPDVWY